jgi:RNA polymerase sigma-70 factor (ECF subfamily)
LRRAIETIPEPFREALVLRDLDELSYRDVAEITGVPMGTVMSRLARARRMLGERMGVLEATA